MTAALTLVQEDWTRFLTLEGLAERSGVPHSRFAQMILKELADNAADIGTEVDLHAVNADVVEVGDNGPGIDLDTFSIKRPLQSSKHWRTGKRGALGNGIRAVLGAVYCLQGHLVVETRGATNRLDVRDVGEVVRTHVAPLRRPGTRIEVHIAGIAEAISFARTAIRHSGDTISTKRPHSTWFDVEAIRDLQRSAEGVTVGAFCSQFLTSYKPADPDSLVTDWNANELLRQLQINAPTKTPTVKPHGPYLYGEHYSKESGEYLVGNARLPYVVEVWADAETGTGDLSVYSPIINRTNALSGLGLTVGGKQRLTLHVGGKWHSLPKPERDRLTLRKTVDYEVVISISTPYVPILSSGKAPDLSGLAGPILHAVAKACRKAHNGLKRTTRSMSIADAVNSLLPAAYDRVSDGGTYWANARQLMYEMRPDILEMTGKTSFSDNYITQTLIPGFIDANPDLTSEWRIAYDKRGHLIEPHTGATVGLGTVEVAEYTSRRSRISFDRAASRVGLLSNLDPQHRFRGLLFVEKEGFTELIQDSGILEQFDLALASTKGMSVIAARALIDDMAGRVDGFTVYVAADFDITGQSIGFTLTSDSDRYQFQHDVNVVDLGVNWGQARELHEAGRSEVVEVKGRDADADRLSRRGMDADAVEFLTDCDEPRRVELNALRPAEFLKMLREGIGTPRKLVPPDTVLADAWRELSIRARLRELETELRSGEAPDVPDALCEAVTEALQDDPEQSWDAAILDLIEGGGHSDEQARPSIPPHLNKRTARRDARRAVLMK